jgi:hypothetical protein
MCLQLGWERRLSHSILGSVRVLTLLKHQALFTLSYQNLLGPVKNLEVFWLHTNVSEEHAASIYISTVNMEAACSSDVDIEPKYCTAQQPRNPRSELILPWKYQILHINNSWNRVLLEKLIVRSASLKIPVFYGTRRFITLFTRALHRPLVWTTWIESTPS